jgi:hypothetical protein
MRDVHDHYTGIYKIANIAMNIVDTGQPLVREAQEFHHGHFEVSQQIFGAKLSPMRLFENVKWNICGL